MPRKTSKRQAAAGTRRPFQPRDLLFAGLGAVSLGRKQVAVLRTRAKAEAGPVKKKVVAMAKDTRTQLEARLPKVLELFGLKKAKAKRASRKPVAPRTRKAA